MTMVYGIILEIIHGYDRRLLEHLRVCKENELRQIHYMNCSPLNKDSIVHVFKVCGLAVCY